MLRRHIDLDTKGIEKVLIIAAVYKNILEFKLKLEYNPRVQTFYLL